MPLGKDNDSDFTNDLHYRQNMFLESTHCI